MPVRLRVAVFFAAILALVLAGAGVFLLSRTRSEVRASVDAGLRSRTSILLTDVEDEFVDVGKHEGVIDEAEAMAQVVDSRGRVLESSSSIGDEPLLAPSDLTGLRTRRSFERALRMDGASQDTRLLATRADNGAIVVVGASIEDANHAIAALARSLWLGGPIVVLVATGAVWLLAGVALRPMERMRAEAEALSLGSDRHRLPVPSTGDELARLAETLNDMLERLEAAVERERRFVDDASHELRTPLAILKTELELALRRSRTAEELEAAIRSAAEEVDGLAALSEHLLLLARADRGMLATRRTQVDVAQLVEQVCAGFEPRTQDVELVVSDSARVPMWAQIDPLLVRQAVSNLIDNALGHTPAGGRVSVGVSTRNGSTDVVVEDTGTGFDLDVLPRAFEPFVHADGARRRHSGTGLGLAIVQAVAQAHGGSAEARNIPDGGATVVLRLPS